MSNALPGSPPGLPDYGPDVWQGRQVRRDIPVLPSGHAKLDRHLPGHGWPLGALTELLSETPGAGEFSLLLPVLAAITAQGRWLLLLDPPWVPYPPAMRGHGVALERVMLIRTRSAEESLWACEQALRGVRGGAVLAWHEDPGFAQLRRLQLAARAGHKAAFLFRPMASIGQASPAALRLLVKAQQADISISILKCRGARSNEAITIRRPRQLPGYAALSAPGPEDHPRMPARVPDPSEPARAGHLAH